MDTKARSPLFLAMPVIVIHIGTDDTEEGRRLAACCGEVFERDIPGSFPYVPRVPCQACLFPRRRD